MIFTFTACLWMIHDATGWAPIKIDAPAVTLQPREVWA
ncbi:hypothetical protein ACSSV6_003327 [Roseovarius sp. MBR-38]|jgi:hypothetical protein